MPGDADKPHSGALVQYVSRFPSSELPTTPCGLPGCTSADTLVAMTNTAGPLTGPLGRRVSARRAELRQVLDRHGVRNARLFGSVARGDDDNDSDVDILVDFAPGTGLFAIAGIQAELEEILGTDVDLIPDAGLKDNVRAHVENDMIAL